MAQATETRERRSPPEGTRTASLQLKIAPEGVNWAYATLRNQPRVVLYDDEFPDPFTHLTYTVGQTQNQLFFVAQFALGEEFRQRYPQGIGSAKDLSSLLQRYSQHQFSPDNQQLVVAKDGQIKGAIARVADNCIVIQRGGQVGPLKLSEQTPVNSLAVSLEDFNLLVQRYAGAIWKTSSETDQKQVQLVLSIPPASPGAVQTYLSTFEIMRQQGFEEERPRKLRLEDIGGYPSMRTGIQALIQDCTTPDVSRMYGTQPFANRFILVTGREGVGKSLWVKPLYWTLRSTFKNIEYYRLHLDDLFTQYGPSAATVVETILNHARENEKHGVFTIVHIDYLEQLIQPGLRRNGDTTTTLTEAAINYSLKTINPVIVALGSFGRDLGGLSHHTILYGESRETRGLLPDAIKKTFRRAFALGDPTADDLVGILRAQIETTRGFALSTGHDPFVPEILSRLEDIAPHGIGLNGSEVKQVFLDIAASRKASWDGRTYVRTTDEDIIKALAAKRAEKGIAGTLKRPIGFGTIRPNR